MLQVCAVGWWLVAECTGTALLLIAIVGSGIMGERLAGGNVGIALLANSVANAVTITRALTDTFTAVRMVDVRGFFAAQIAGAFAATALFAWLVPSLQSRAPHVVEPHEGARG